MSISDIKEQHDHPSWFTAAGTAVAYGLILAVMTILLFGLPWAIFSLL
ncbi:MAG: hypothetical protein ACI8U4_002011 [Natronomonas sp.]|jgi:hypothetical protein